MSIKRQIKSKFQNFKFSIQTMTLPAWFTSRGARLIMFSTLFIFGTAYILNITSSATGGYQVSMLEKRTESLQTEVQKLEIEIADNSSIGSIATRVTKLNMVESTGVKHLTLESNAVAKK